MMAVLTVSVMVADPVMPRPVAAMRPVTSPAEVMRSAPRAPVDRDNEETFAENNPDTAVMAPAVKAPVVRETVVTAPVKLIVAPEAVMTGALTVIPVTESMVMKPVVGMVEAMAIAPVDPSILMVPLLIPGIGFAVKETFPRPVTSALMEPVPAAFRLTEPIPWVPMLMTPPPVVFREMAPTPTVAMLMAEDPAMAKETAFRAAVADEETLKIPVAPRLKLELFARVAFNSVGELLSTTAVVPVDWVTPVPPLRTGRTPVTGAGPTDGTTHVRFPEPLLRRTVLAAP